MRTYQKLQQQQQHYVVESKKQSSKLQSRAKLFNEDLKEVTTERIARQGSGLALGGQGGLSEDINEEFFHGIVDYSNAATERQPNIQDQLLELQIQNHYSLTPQDTQEEDQKIEKCSIVEISECKLEVEGGGCQLTNENVLGCIGEQQQVSAPPQVIIQQQQQQQPQQKPYTFYVYGGNYPETVVDALLARGNWQEGREEDCIEKCNLLWRPFNYPPDGYKRIDKRMVRSNQTFIYNHFEVLKGLTTKSGLVRSLKQYYFNNELARQAGYSTFDSTPTTFLLASGIEDAEWSDFKARYQDIIRGYAPKERIPIKHCVNNIWLVKPANANQGRGIEIFSDVDDLTQFVHSRPPFTCCVVQKYIERPMLFKGRKFDIRVWAFFTHRNEVFMYKHGYLRTSSDSYNLQNGNNYVHLTNNCLQKYGSNYGIHEEGNTVGFDVLQEFLDENFPQYKLSVQEHFIPRMKDLIIDSFNSTKHQLNPNRRKPAFELLGYDFLIDEDFRLWMIEINTNPYFGVPNNFIAQLLPKMMDDLLDIVVDPYCPPLIKPENLNRPNDYELLYCEGGSPYSPGPVNQRRPFGVSLYPVPELAQVVGPKAPRQDLKYLKRFKISNLQLSTVTFKHTAKEDEVPHAPAVAKGQTQKTRSKSQMPQKGVRQPQFMTTSGQKSSTIKETIEERSNRSRSIYTKVGIVNNNASTMSTAAIKHRPNSSNRQSLIGKPQQPSSSTTLSAVTAIKKSTPFILSKTPKCTHSSNGKAGNIVGNSGGASTYIARNANNTQRSTPRYDSGQMKCQIGKNRGSSKSDLMNLSFKNGLSNTTKEASSLEMQSSISSQDKFLFKKLRDTSPDKKELTFIEFEKLFNSISDRLSSDKADPVKTSVNLSDLNQLLDNDKSGYIMQDQFIWAFLQLLTQNPDLPTSISYYSIELIQKLSQKLQMKQTLSKPKFLEALLHLYKRPESDGKMKATLASMLTNMTCIYEARKNTDILSSNDMVPLRISLGPFASGNSSQTAQKDVQGVTILKQQMYGKNLSNGLILFVLSEIQDQNFFKLLSIADIDTLIAQLHQIQQAGHNSEHPLRQKELSYPMNLDRESGEPPLSQMAFEQSHSQGYKREEQDQQKDNDVQQQYRAVNTDPADTGAGDDFNPMMMGDFSDDQDTSEFKCKNLSEFNGHEKQRMDLSFDNRLNNLVSPSKKKIPSKRSDRLIEKEIRSNQDSQYNSPSCQTPQVELSNTVVTATVKQPETPTVLAQGPATLKTIISSITAAQKLALLTQLNNAKELKLRSLQQKRNEIFVLDQRDVGSEVAPAASQKKSREGSMSRGGKFASMHNSPQLIFNNKQQQYIDTASAQSINDQPRLNQPMLLQTPDKQLRKFMPVVNSKSLKDTPPKESASAKPAPQQPSQPSQPNVLTNFLSHNQMNRNSYAQSLMNSNHLYNMMNSSASSNLIPSSDDMSQRYKFQPVLRNKQTNIQPTGAIKSITDLQKASNEKQMAMQSASQMCMSAIKPQTAAYCNYIQQKGSYSEMGKVKQTRAQSRSSATGSQTATKCDQHHEKRYQQVLKEQKYSALQSKLEAQQRNDMMLNQINQKINDIQQNLNILSQQSSKKDLINSNGKQVQAHPPQPPMIINTLDSMESNSSCLLRLAEPEELPVDYQQTQSLRQQVCPEKTAIRLDQSNPKTMETQLRTQLHSMTNGPRNKSKQPLHKNQVDYNEMYKKNTQTLYHHSKKEFFISKTDSMYGDQQVPLRGRKNSVNEVSLKDKKNSFTVMQSATPILSNQKKTSMCKQQDKIQRNSMLELNAGF